MIKNKTEKNRNDGKYNQTGITVKIHTNHAGVRATAITLRSIAVCSSWRSSVIAVKQASGTTTAPFEWKNKSLLWYPFRCVEWKATSVTATECHDCHPDRSLCSDEFGCRSFIKYSPWTVCFLLVLGKTCVFLWATILPSFTEHFTFRFCIGD